MCKRNRKMPEITICCDSSIVKNKNVQKSDRTVALFVFSILNILPRLNYVISKTDSDLRKSFLPLFRKQIGKQISVGDYGNPIVITKIKDLLF